MLAAVRIAPGATAVSRRPPQRVTAFTPGDLDSPYYNDLAAGRLDASLESETARLAALIASRSALNPVTEAPLGLGALDRRAEDEGWRQLAAGGQGALGGGVEGERAIPYRFAIPHTYALEPPWVSVMAQGQAASLF